MKKKIKIFTFIILATGLGLISRLYVAGDKSAQGASNSANPNSQIKNASSSAEAVKIPIFVYHSVSPYYPSESNFRKKFAVEPDIFEKQMRYLKDNGYAAMSLYDLANHFSQKTALPEKSVIITLDDGWENQYKYAFPILKKYGDIATFFIFTNAIGHKHFLTWPQIKELSAAGMIIGDHSKSHPYLFKITDKDELRQEIIGSREILENNLGKKIDIFAYPFGRYNEEIIAILKENGFVAARTDGYKGVFHASNDLFTLKTVDAKDSLTEFVEDLRARQ
ncbi:MAG: polysaccharide deacetylase family protein [Patescibacteria group bacterium]|nr:polysaccharide deacetylase family protein [Patescibacteria group bacterium]MDE1988166.1 polysaccharide deacetylase family protein [Patescibacteria group bacterium]MDE2217986.1 polysaccharide deacetylase family protein [Patescibacteria group bacterium]